MVSHQESIYHQKSANDNGIKLMINIQGTRISRMDNISALPQPLGKYHHRRDQTILSYPPSTPKNFIGYIWAHTLHMMQATTTFVHFYLSDIHFYGVITHFAHITLLFN